VRCHRKKYSVLFFYTLLYRPFGPAEANQELTSFLPITAYSTDLSPVIGRPRPDIFLRILCIKKIYILRPPTRRIFLSIYNFDGFVKSRQVCFSAIPAKAGIHYF